MTAQYVGFQLAIELSNVLPIKELAQAGITKVVDLARTLRKSGSDIVVEEDLAAVFGRGTVSADLERKFRAVVIKRFTGPEELPYTSLYNGSKIGLYGGPGPTATRALQDSTYLATVLTLSMLSYFHSRESLATMLSASMTKRTEEKVQGATGDPGYDAISGTLGVCSAETSSFQWSQYRQVVEDRLRSAMPDCRITSDHVGLTPSLFLGLMDFLYIAQRLPLDRKITIDCEIGCITVVIWAHYILELNVVIVGTPKGDIVFGNSNEQQIIITWTGMHNQPNDWDVLCWPDPTLKSTNVILRLHEKDMSVILSCEPLETDRMTVDVDERHSLSGYGTTYIRRLFNNEILIKDDHPAYEESVRMILGLALHASKHLRRDFAYEKDTKQPRCGNPIITLEAWRILAATEVLFAGIGINIIECQDCAVCLGQTKFDEAFLLPSLRELQNRFPHGSPGTAQNLLKILQGLSMLVILIACTSNLRSCQEMPIRLLRHLPLQSKMLAFCDGHVPYIPLAVNDVFDALIILLDTDASRDLRNDTHRIHLSSAFGWSIFLDTMGGKDPGCVSPHLIHVQKGTSTKIDTQERKQRIRDGRGNLKKFAPIKQREVIFRLTKYTPRSFAHVRKSDFWSTQSQEFEMTMYLDIEPFAEWEAHGAVPFEGTLVYHRMHHSLWRTHSTKACDHFSDSDASCTPTGRALGREAVVLASHSIPWQFHLDDSDGIPEKIAILLTWRQPYLRWAAICDAVPTRSWRTGREVMLRTEMCCEACAVSQIMDLPGKWILIL